MPHSTLNYRLRLEPGCHRLVFDRWPRPGDVPFTIERPLLRQAGQPVRLKVIVAGTMIVVYANDQVALYSRGYDQISGDCGVFVSVGAATFSNTRLLTAE